MSFELFVTVKGPIDFTCKPLASHGSIDVLELLQAHGFPMSHGFAARHQRRLPLSYRRNMSSSPIPVLHRSDMENNRLKSRLGLVN